MDCKQFFKYFIENNSTHTITAGLQHSVFNANINVSEIVRTILQKFGFENINCQKSGLPIMGESRAAKKISYKSGFDIMLNNLLTIINYEFAKYILFAINGKKVLEAIIENSKLDEINNYQSLLNNVIHWTNLFDKMNFKFDFKNFNDQIISVPFYKVHQTLNINDILNFIIEDLSSDKLKMSEFIDTKEIVLQTLDLIVDNCSQTIYAFNTIEGLILHLGVLDIGYSGSFIELINHLYISNPNYENVVKKYEMKNLFDNDLKPNLINYFKHLLENISNLHPDIVINMSETLLDRLVTIILNYYVTIGLNMRETYFITLGFGKESRIHFETVYRSIVQSKCNYHYLTQSQKVILHYALLTSDSITKTLSLIKNDDTKSNGSKQDDTADDYDNN